jgi:3-oxoacyl-[acyl-carrier protein] reductase
MKTVVITGGSKGIGFSTATLFAQDGYRVLNISRSPISLPGAEQHTIDLSDPLWARHHGERLRSSVEGSEQVVVVHNAGLLAKDSVLALEAEDFHRVLQVNVVASAQLNQLLVPTMAAGSSIIYVGSTLSEKAVANSCSYATSKHAVIGLMRATCQDLAGRNIHTACVCPGFTDTEMLRAHVGNDADILRSLAGGVTLGRLIEPIEIARTIRFCATNSVINGAVIHANLGQIER